MHEKLIWYTICNIKLSEKMFSYNLLKFKIQFVIIEMNLVYVVLIKRIIRLPFNNQYFIIQQMWFYCKDNMYMMPDILNR